MGCCKTQQVQQQQQIKDREIAITHQQQTPKPRRTNIQLDNTEQQIQLELLANLLTKQGKDVSSISERGSSLLHHKSQSVLSSFDIQQQINQLLQNHSNTSKSNARMSLDFAPQNSSFHKNIKIQLQKLVQIGDLVDSFEVDLGNDTKLNELLKEPE